MNNFLLLLSLTTPSMDVRVEGGAYLRFLREGRVVYSQVTKLAVVDGRLAHPAGHRLMPEIVVPSGTREFEVTEDGTVKLLVGGQWVTSNRIVLAHFSGAQPIPGEDGLAIASARPKLAAANPAEGTRILFGEAAALVSLKVVASEVVEPPPVTKVPAPQEPPARTPEVSRTIPTPGTPISWVIPAELRINGDQIKLGDLFNLSGLPNGEAIASVVVDAAPPLGQARRIDKGRIEMKLRQAGLDPSALKVSGASSTLVTRASQSIGHEVLAAQAMESLKGALGETWRITDQTRDAGPIRLPEGEITYSSSQVRVTGSSATVVVEVLVGGQKQGNRMFTYRVESLIAMPKVGATVTVIARSGGIRIELQARVIRVDLATQTLEVETTERNRLTGRLVRENTVEVIL